MPRAAASRPLGPTSPSRPKAAATTAMKDEVDPTGRPTNASFTPRTPCARQLASTSSGSA
ncbi:MAG: hypothetical protein DMF77_05660 [Acidobacteria bacterium]|nr:MAG: hypothetical protein DMF77_05660 [Acidobacteriota bacterium]